jgi:type I restriction enzyme S subunit
VSKLSQLVENLCPDGVEHQPLGELGTLYGGLTGKSKKDFSAGDGLFIPYTNIFANERTDLDALESVTVGPSERQNIVARGDVLFTGSSESLEDVGMTSVVTSEPAGRVYLNSFSIGFRWHRDDLILPSFASHLFRSQPLRQQIVGTANGVTRFNVSKAELRRVLIPLPPLDIQRAVVNALDPMRDLLRELEGERLARDQQYSHYRTLLLSEHHADGRASMLGEALQLKAGKFIAASKVSAVRDNEHPFPCFGGGGLRGYVADPSHRGPRSLIGRQGALCGNVKHAEGSFYATEHAVVVTPRAGVHGRWAYHMLTEMNLNRYATKSAQPGLSVRVLSELPVHLPPLSEQTRIAATLDSFDALVNDPSSGIPAEIAARRKQYEYYRDLLLTFPEKKTAA